MDPLSDLLSLLKPDSYITGGFAVHSDLSVRFPQHRGIKCYAVLSGGCWLSVEGVPDPVRLSAGDCYLLPRGLPFCLATDLALTPVDFTVLRASRKWDNTLPTPPGDTACHLVGGHFVLTGNQARMLLDSLPPIVHIQKESDKAAMRWSLDRMREELHQPAPGGTLIAQQLAYMMLIQAVRLHLAGGAHGSVGWLSALADPQMSLAIACMHQEPGQNWTLQKLAARAGMSRSIFAERFKTVVGSTAIEYLTRWRMLLAADRLKASRDSISTIAQSLGYESDSAFGKAFRRVMGSSPRQYLRREDTTVQA